jgi:hypothetical protein
MVVGDKITQFIQKTGVKPSECKYHSWRDIEDKAGNKVGKVRILVPKSDNIARVEFLCPECKKEHFKEQEFNNFQAPTGRKAPFVVECSCGNKIQIRRMQDEVKKKKKKAE